MEKQFIEMNNSLFIVLILAANTRDDHAMIVCTESYPKLTFLRERVMNQRAVEISQKIITV